MRFHYYRDKRSGKKMKVLQTITRLYVDCEQLEASIAFYESFFGEPCGVRESYPEIGVEAAQVGSFLLLAGSEQALAPFKNTQANLLVDSIEEWKDFLLKHGATIIEGPKQAPTGLEMRARHPDGAQIKYVQFGGSVYQDHTSR
jgi:predicted enzyme related to lactoylglutathione lyase